jgi:hypothetical protein
MKNGQKETAQGGSPERSVFRTCVKNDCKMIISYSPESASPNFAGEEALFVSEWELVLITIGIGWCVDRLFRVLDAIEGKERDEHAGNQ